MTKMAQDLQGELMQSITQASTKSCLLAAFRERPACRAAFNLALSYLCRAALATAKKSSGTQNLPCAASKRLGPGALRAQSAVVALPGSQQPGYLSRAAVIALSKNRQTASPVLLDRGPLRCPTLHLSARRSAAGCACAVILLSSRFVLTISYAENAAHVEAIRPVTSCARSYAHACSIFRAENKHGSWARHGERKFTAPSAGGETLHRATPPPTAPTALLLEKHESSFA